MTNIRLHALALLMGGVLGCTVLAGWQTPARAGDTAVAAAADAEDDFDLVDQPVRTQLPEELDALYSTRLVFTPQHIPQVTVGIMKGRKRMTVTASGAAQLVVYDPLRRVIDLQQPGTISISASSLTPATLTWLVVVKKLNWRERDLLPKVSRLWKQRGYDISVRPTGGVQGIGGVVMDTRQQLIAAARCDSRAAAKAIADEIFRLFRVRADIIEDIVERPHAKLTVSAGGKKLAVSQDLVWLTPGPGATFEVLRYPTGGSYERDKKPRRRSYQGTLYAVADRHGGASLAEMLDLETLLEGVVPSEIFMSAPIEAIKAQAIAARNQLMVTLGTRHLGDPYSLCDTQHCQVYGGRSAVHPNAHTAIQETRGMFLFDDRGLINTYYSAMSGGFTEDNDTQWAGSSDKALRGVYDGPVPNPPNTFVNGITEQNIKEWIFSPPQELYARYAGVNEKFFRWQRQFDAERFNSLVSKQLGDIGVVKQVKVLSRGVSGRVKAFQIVGSRKTVVIQKPYEIRVMLDKLPSAMFVVETRKGPDNMPREFIFHGGGWGHGVGMCQTGAMGMAAKGKSCTEILPHYYQGSVIKKLY